MDYASYLNGMRERRAIAVFPIRDLPSWEISVGRLPEISRYSVFSRIILPTLDNLGKNLWKQQSKITIAQVGLALERYRAAKGGYPAALADLAPDFIKEVPLDPFTGKPLLYRSEPGGATIYSVGPDINDDGGIEDRETDMDDISWASGTAAVRKFTPPRPKPETEEP
jgi:hypothetical protein